MRTGSPLTERDMYQGAHTVGTQFCADDTKQKQLYPTWSLLLHILGRVELTGDTLDSTVTKEGDTKLTKSGCLAGSRETKF